MSTKVKVEITHPHPPYGVRVTAQYLQDGAWVDAVGPDVLPCQAGANVEGLVYGTRRIIVEEIM